MSDNYLSGADPLGQITGEFVYGLRQGQRPSAEEFARRYPQHANDIGDMLGTSPPCGHHGPLPSVVAG